MGNIPPQYLDNDDNNEIASISNNNNKINNNEKEHYNKKGFFISESNSSSSTLNDALFHNKKHLQTTNNNYPIANTSFSDNSITSGSTCSLNAEVLSNTSLTSNASSNQGNNSNIELNILQNVIDNNINDEEMSSNYLLATQLQPFLQTSLLKEDQHLMSTSPKKGMSTTKHNKNNNIDQQPSPEITISFDDSVFGDALTTSTSDNVKQIRRKSFQQFTNTFLTNNNNLFSESTVNSSQKKNNSPPSPPKQNNNTRSRRFSQIFFGNGFTSERDDNDLRSPQSAIQQTNVSPFEQLKSSRRMSIGIFSPRSNRVDQNKSPTTSPTLLQQEEDEKKNKIQIVMVGAGGCGKTTTFKALKLLLDRRKEVEKSNWEEGLIAPIIDLLFILFEFKRVNFPNLEFKKKETKKIEKEIYKLFEDHTLLSIMNEKYKKLIQNIMEMWENDIVIKQLYTYLMLQKQIPAFPIENLNYYFKRMLFAHYNKNKSENNTKLNSLQQPTDNDLLHSQRKTTGITKMTIDNVKPLQKNNLLNQSINNVTIYDCGGQINERRKWKFMFDEAKQSGGKLILLFFVSLSEFNQKCYEDENLNRTISSLQLFEEICKNEELKDFKMFLIFTKKDVFEQKLKFTKLNVCFDDFTEIMDDKNLIQSTTNKKPNEILQQLPKKVIENWTGDIEKREVTNNENYEYCLQFIKNKFLNKIQNIEQRKFVEKHLKVINTMNIKEIKKELIDKLFWNEIVNEETLQ
ncbi:hypothetical protein ABK040_005162 [Willaertia magna]